MRLISITFLLIVRVGCEWVEISQQHYKKPLRPTHVHPLLATVGKASESTHLFRTPVETVDETVRRTSYRPIINAVRKVSEDDRVIKRNRIYINHTVPDHSWISEQKVANNVNTVKTENNSAKISDKIDSVSTKPTINDETLLHGTKIKGDIIIIRRTKPKETEIVAKYDTPGGHGPTSITGNAIRAHPTNNKGSIVKPQPLDQEPVEVLNLSDIEYTTAYDSFNPGLKSDYNAVSKINDKRNTEYRDSENLHNQEKFKPNRGSSITKAPTAFKGITSMRRVEILRSTQPTLVNDFDDCDNTLKNISSSPKLGSISKDVNKKRASGTTPNKFPNIGQVNRVFIEKAAKISRKPKPEVKFVTRESTNDDVTEQSTKASKVDKPILIRGTAENNFPLRSEPGKLLENGDRKHPLPNPDEVMIKELITGDEKQLNIRDNKLASIGTVKRVLSPTKSTNPNGNNLDRPDSTANNSEPESQTESDEEVTIADEDFSHDYDKNRYFESSTVKLPTISTAKLKPKESIVTKKPDLNPQIERYDPNLYEPIKLNKHLPEFVTTEDRFGYNTNIKKLEKNAESNKIKNKTESNNQYDISKEETRQEYATEKPTAPETQSNDNSEEAESKNSISNQRKNNAMENLIKFLRTVTDIITRNTRRGVSGKVRYLEDLRDTIMMNIEERLEAEFPDDGGSRRARSAEPRGHVEFPSSEGALMTISFLTFAVFLIKLVLQVIQAYKNKTMMVMPTVVAAVGRAYNQRTRTKF